MSGLRAAFKDFLADDTTLSALLTGGIFDAQDFDQEGLSMDNVPRDTDGVTILPNLVIRWQASTLFSSYKIGAEAQTVELYFYDHLGYDTIEAALSRGKVLLHDIYMEADDRGLAHIRWAFHSRQSTADELGNAPMMFSRYLINQTRK